MKKFIKIISLSISFIMLASQALLAAEFMMMYGKTDSDTTQVTLLVLDADVTDRTNLTPGQIKYIDQSSVDEDGNFSIMLPFFDTNEYSVYSNLDFSVADGDEKMTAYVSSAGSDSNSGLSVSEPFKTLEMAYSNIAIIDEIVLLDDTVYTEAPAHSGIFTIRGNSSLVKLTLPSEVSLKGDLTIDNVLISGKSSVYANGYKLKITETVTSDAGNGTSASGKALSVYGGKKNADYTGDTYLELLGGKYNVVYGGCLGGTLNGDTNIILGGNANSGDGIDDGNASTMSQCSVYGDGNNGIVKGKTNITITDNAVSGYVFGAGYNTNGLVDETNIRILGGKVMNVYGGSRKDTTLTNCNTNITMNGGLVEAIFGGSESASMTGNAYITLAGGEVSRRIHSGCYNVVSLLGKWETRHHITGKTTLVIYPEANLATGKDLYGDNDSYRAVGSGSRHNYCFDDEVNTLILLNDSYSKNEYYINKSYGRHADYTVKATTGGTVAGTTVGGKIMITPNNGYYAIIGNKEYEKGEFVISTDTTTVTFKKKNFFIYEVNATKGENKADGIANINADNSTANEISPTLYVSVFDFETGKLIDCAVSEATTGQKSFSLNGKFEEGKKYIVKAMMWNGNMEPLTAVYSLELK